MSCFSNYAKAEIPPDSVFDYHAFLLLVFGGTSTWNEAFEVLRCAKDHRQTSPDGEALLVEMQEPVRESRTLTGIGMAVIKLLIKRRGINRQPTIQPSRLNAKFN